MTVKCIPADMQETICAGFTGKLYTINQMAAMTGTSRRTIIRVLENAGIDAGVKPRQKKVTLTASMMSPKEMAELCSGIPELAAERDLVIKHEAMHREFLASRFNEPIEAIYMPTTVLCKSPPKPWYRRVLDAFARMTSKSDHLHPY